VLEVPRATPVPAPTVVAADPADKHCGASAILLIRLPGHPSRHVDRGEDAFGRELATALDQTRRSTPRCARARVAG
jgi:hypothetical protein